MALDFIRRHKRTTATQPLPGDAGGESRLSSQPVTAPFVGDRQPENSGPLPAGIATDEDAGPAAVAADRSLGIGPVSAAPADSGEMSAAPSPNVICDDGIPEWTDDPPACRGLQTPGPLRRVPVLQLAKLDDGTLWDRLALVADRRVWLEKHGAPGDAAELRGLRAEMRWCCEYRPAVFAGLLLPPAGSQNLTSAPSPNVTPATLQNPTSAHNRSQPAKGARPDRWPVPFAGGDRQAPCRVTLTACHLESVGWDAMTADRLARALAGPVSPGTRMGPAVISDPENWRRALTADALRGPKGPRAVGVQADLRALEGAAAVKTHAPKFHPGDLAELPAIGDHTPPEHWEAIGGDAAVLPLAGEGVRFRLWFCARLFQRDGTAGPWHGEYREMWQRHGGRIA